MSFRKIIVFAAIVAVVGGGAVYIASRQSVGHGSLQGTIGATLSVVIQSPSANTSLSSPVSVHATYTGSASYMKLWIDHVASTSTVVHNTSTLNASVSLSNGAHLLEVQAADAKTGAVYTTPVSITIVPSVVVRSPVNGATITTSTVYVAATYTGSASYMKLWIDHVADATTTVHNTNTFSTTVSLSNGAHLLEVQAADSSTGVVYTTPVNITVNVPVAVMPHFATTTLAIETGNNTSAASNFGSLSCKNYYTGGAVACTATGDTAPANVSKVNVHTLLYSGNSTLVFAHLMPWFGSSSHMNVGYNSNDASEVNRQVNDMISRGLNGFSVDWYGPSSTSDQVTQKWQSAVAGHPGFLFWIIIDKGSLSNAGVAEGADGTAALISQMNYIANTYYASPNYWKVGGRPIVSNFDLDLHFKINWATVFASVKGNPDFIYQNNSGFTHSNTAGSFAWGPTSAPTSYLPSFYGVALNYPSLTTVGSTYKGFNDQLASWTGNRVNAQSCGQTWLQTFAAANAKYSSSKQLSAMQLVTWNDYEEGTELETGIDNCVSITTSVSGNTLNWTLTGSESTIDHYAIFASTDGQNLMQIGTVAAGTHSFNIPSSGLISGKYQLYVKAVGKPFFMNHTSQAVSYSF